MKPKDIEILSMNLNNIHLGNIVGCRSEKPFGLIIYGDMDKEQAEALKKEIPEAFMREKWLFEVWSVLEEDGTTQEVRIQHLKELKDKADKWDKWEIQHKKLCEIIDSMGDNRYVTS